MANFYGCEMQVVDADAPTTPSDENISEILEIIRPKPSPRPLIRIGGSGDGAYLLPDDLSGISACFSPGVANRKDFEDELAERFGIASHMCDFSSDASKLKTPLRSGMQTFLKKWLDVNGSDDAISLDAWVAQQEACAASDLLLQIDIEGAEYRNILGARESTLDRFRIIAIEIHGLRKIFDAQIVDSIFIPFFRKISRNFICVHSHPNNCCGEVFVTEPVTKQVVNLPAVLELTFLRRDRFPSTIGEGAKLANLIPPRLPHPLDVVNVPSKPPITLLESWLGVPRQVDSKVKILEERLDYLSDFAIPAQIENVLVCIEGIRNELSLRRRETSYPLASEGLINIASGKRFSLSRPFDKHRGTGIVEAKSPYFFHTANAPGQWITVDLEATCRLSYIRIKNRTDTRRDRARLLFYVTHNDKSINFSEGKLIEFDSSFLCAPDVDSVTDLFGASARYFTIYSPIKTAIHLSAIEIWGVANQSHVA